jgi:hypothetical protein
MKNKRPKRRMATIMNNKSKRPWWNPFMSSVWLQRKKAIKNKVESKSGGIK